MRTTRRWWVGAALAACLLGGAAPASAQNIAVFGNNDIDDWLSSQGFTTTIVSDAQLATPGFLNSFSAFVYTRDGSSFGSGLSAAAAANVQTYVGSTGNRVLFNGDFADGILGDVQNRQLIKNAATWATGSGRGFIGEFNGAAAALTTNSNGFAPLNLVGGSAGPLGGGAGGSGGSINLTAAGTGHAVTSGVSFPYNSPNVEFGAQYTGVNPAFILATYDSGNAAIVAVQGVPEPISLALFAPGLAVVGILKRRKKSQETDEV